MLECYDQDDLLAYIEDALAPSEAAALRSRLESDVAAGELIEAMRRDRARLMAEPEPELPVDFAALVEPMLVRPMLMEAFADAAPRTAASRPGRQRRLHRRQRQLRTARRFAVAAVVAILATGGLWFAFTNLDLGSGFQRVASSTEQSDGVMEELPQHDAAMPAWGDPSATVHHHSPSLIPTDELLASSTSGQPQRNATAAESIVTAGDLVLVIASKDAAAAEQLLVEAAGDLGETVALVQNFSYDEAKRLEQLWLQIDSRETPQREVVAGSGTSRSSEFDVLAERSRKQYRSSRPSVSVDLSKQLLGPAELAATFAQQLEFSSRGATHTITLSVQQLQDLLIQLAMLDGHTAVLCSANADALLDGSASFADRAAVQRTLRELHDVGEDVTILLPVTIVQAR